MTCLYVCMILEIERQFDSNQRCERIMNLAYIFQYIQTKIENNHTWSFRFSYMSLMHIYCIINCTHFYKK
jgi:hypothetical protein